jgi:hypothetical protein
MEKKNFYLLSYNVLSLYMILLADYNMLSDDNSILSDNVKWIVGIKY